MVTEWAEMLDLYINIGKIVPYSDQFELLQQLFETLFQHSLNFP